MGAICAWELVSLPGPRIGKPAWRFEREVDSHSAADHQSAPHRPVETAPKSARRKGAGIPPGAGMAQIQNTKAIPPRILRGVLTSRNRSPPEVLSGRYPWARRLCTSAE